MSNQNERQSICVEREEGVDNFREAKRRKTVDEVVRQPGPDNFFSRKNSLCFRKEQPENVISLTEISKAKAKVNAEAWAKAKDEAKAEFLTLLAQQRVQ